MKLLFSLFIILNLYVSLGQCFDISVLYSLTTTQNSPFCLSHQPFVFDFDYCFMRCEDPVIYAKVQSNSSDFNNKFVLSSYTESSCSLSNAYDKFYYECTEYGQSYDMGNGTTLTCRDANYVPFNSVNVTYSDCKQDFIPYNTCQQLCDEEYSFIYNGFKTLTNNFEVMVFQNTNCSGTPISQIYQFSAGASLSLGDLVINVNLTPDDEPNSSSIVSYSLMVLFIGILLNILF